LQGALTCLQNEPFGRDLHPMTLTWDIFCSVIDYFGDIGVCWRLARQLSAELQQSVRLWVDDLPGFQRMCRAVDPRQALQRVEGVEVRHWTKPFPRVEPADIAIEGFGVRLPDTYVEAMAARSPHPVWINLEYLSAESWVEGCHKLPSPHPRLPLVKYFFFPGFTRATGGLLIESGLAQRRDAFQSDPAAVDAFWRALDLAPLEREALSVSLFCYDNAALASLVDAWSRDTRPVVCIVPDGPALAQLALILRQSIAPGSRIGRGNLTVRAIPFLELDQYDRLLWACDLNFVRGEDSFVRAQLAGRPLMWQAYRQEDGAHLRKVSAFVARYASGLPEDARLALDAIMQAWNCESADAGRYWPALRGYSGIFSAHARQWAGRLAAGSNLAAELAKFCQDLLK